MAFQLSLGYSPRQPQLAWPQWSGMMGPMLWQYLGGA